MSIQAYVKRGVQGRLKQATDDAGDQFSVGNQNYLRTVNSRSSTRDTFMNGQSESVLLGNETVNVSIFSRSFGGKRAIKRQAIRNVKSLFIFKKPE